MACIKSLRLLGVTKDIRDPFLQGSLLEAGNAPGTDEVCTSAKARSEIQARDPRRGSLAGGIK